MRGQPVTVEVSERSRQARGKTIQREDNFKGESSERRGK